MQTIITTIFVIVAICLIIYLIFKKDIDQQKGEAVTGVVIALLLFALIELFSRLIHPLAGPIFFGIAILSLIGFWIYRRKVAS